MDFRFNLSVSDQSFEKKLPKGSPIYSKLTFTQKTVSLLQFLEIIRNGYMFCGVYDNKKFPNNGYETSKHLVSNNIISIDIDDCDCSMMDFMSTLKYSPSIAYETFSNLEEGNGFRFRFLYVFDDFVNGETYRRLYHAICKANAIECSSNDTSTGSPYQKIWGTNAKHRNVIGLGYVYHIDSFKEFMDDEKCPVPVYNIKQQHHPNNNTLKPDTPRLTDKEFEEAWNNSINNADVLSKMRHYQTYECTQIEWKEGELWRDLEDTHYYEIKRKWEMRLVFNGGRYKRVPVNIRLKNGEHRRKKIFLSLMRRRFIDNTITLEHLCYAALYELHYFIDNSVKEDYITRNQLMQIAQTAYSTDLERYKEKLRKNKHFKINKMERIKRGLSPAQAVAMANREIRKNKKEKEYLELAKKYDPKKSIRQNAEILGIKKTKCSELKKWLIERQNNEAEQLPTNEEKTRQNASKCPQIENEEGMDMCCEDMIRDMYRIIKNTFEPEIKKSEKMDLSWMKKTMKHLANSKP